MKANNEAHRGREKQSGFTPGSGSQNSENDNSDPMRERKTISPKSESVKHNVGNEDPEKREASSYGYSSEQYRTRYEKKPKDCCEADQKQLKDEKAEKSRHVSDKDADGFPDSRG